MSKTTLETIGLALIVLAAPLLWTVGALDQSRAGLQLGQIAAWRGKAEGR